MSKEVTGHVDYWLASARHDLSVANTLFRNKKYDWCLYVAHLVLEKTLKAFWLKKKEEHPPKTHNLLTLADGTGISLSIEQREFLGIVNDFNLEVRYPQDRMKFYKICNQKFTQEYFKRMKEFYKWLRLQIGNIGG